jgi:hypothetical protein
MTTTLAKPLTNLQFELLKYFQYEVKDEELLEIKRLLSDYFAKKAMDDMDKLWDTKGWSNETMDTWLNDENQ